MRNFVRPERGLHVVDIENLAGTGRPACEEVSEIRERYGRLVTIAANDHVVLGCNHGAALAVGLHWGGRLVLGSGPDGADHALIEVLANEQVSGRFDAVYLASGDGIFAAVVAELSQAGVPVTVVSRPECLSRTLRLAASKIIYFDGPALPSPFASAREAV